MTGKRTVGTALSTVVVVAILAGVSARSGSATPRAAGRKDESGRGLGIVDALAQSWGTTPLPDGKVVWFDVAR